MKPRILILLACLLANATLAGEAAPRFNTEPSNAERGPSRSTADNMAGRENRRGPVHRPPAFVPDATLDVILGRPTDTAVVLSILHHRSDADLRVVYGTSKESLSSRTAILPVRRGQPREIELTGLKAGARYHYRVIDVANQMPLAEGAFHTQRAPGSTFVFTVSADSHLDQNTDPALYQRTLANALADGPDFHIDLGDTFMTEKHPDRDAASQQYLAQRLYFGQLGHSVPLYLALGNHDGEERRHLREGPQSLAVWANAQRKRYFPNPLPDRFYTGNETTDPWAGTLQDYYAWHWGDALLIVLNPYWHGSGGKRDERWGLSLGEAQYRWLKRTLENSRARFKIVSIHQLTGGLDRQGRGGAEAVAFGEWGGKNGDGSAGFPAHRPDWDMPVHDLLIRHRVALVLHGHDHLYACQERDGIVYLEVPQPGHPGPLDPRDAAEYGYRGGTILGGAGHLRITVSPTRIVSEYVRSQVGQDAQPGRANRQVLDSCITPPPRRR